MMLDLDSVRLFILTAEYGNLTRAAEAAGTAQPAVSQKLKGLEAALGRKLLDRTPRFVRLTEAGVTFLDRARTLLAAHEAAIASSDEPAPHIALGISDHALGGRLDVVLARLRAALPIRATLSVQLGQSAHIRRLFESGAVNLAIIRREGGGEEGEVLGEDPLDWRAAADWRAPTGPVPLVLLPAPCAVRAAAINSLEKSGLRWRETFVGGSCLALIAAVKAGIGVAPLGRIVGADLSAAPSSLEGLDLPALPASQIVLLARATDAVSGAAARALAASVRDLLRRSTA